MIFKKVNFPLREQTGSILSSRQMSFSRAGETPQSWSTSLCNIQVPIWKLHTGKSLALKCPFGSTSNDQWQKNLWCGPWGPRSISRRWPFAAEWGRDLWMMLMIRVSRYEHLKVIGPVKRHRPAKWLWTSHLTFVSHSFQIYKRKTIR